MGELGQQSGAFLEADSPWKKCSGEEPQKTGSVRALLEERAAAHGFNERRKRQVDRGSAAGVLVVGEILRRDPPKYFPNDILRWSFIEILNRFCTGPAKISCRQIL